MGGKTAPANKINRVVWVQAQEAIDTLRQPFLVLDDDFRVLMANKSFYKVFRSLPAGTEGKELSILGGGQWDIPELRRALSDSLSRSRHTEDIEVSYELPHGGSRTFMVNVRAISRESGLTPIVLLAIEDVGGPDRWPAQTTGHVPRPDKMPAPSIAELEARVKELERLNKAMVGRELKMMELKQEIKELKKVH